MIIPFLLLVLITQIQASQHELIAPRIRSYMSMSKQELQREQQTKQQELLHDNIHWHQEKVCGIKRDIIGMSAVCCIVSTGIATGMYCDIPPFIIVPWISGAAAACDRCYQPDQRAKKAELEEINTFLKVKTD